MSGSRFALYLITMAAVTYLIRALPFVLFRKKIENRFVLSVLYYAPYAVLGAMTFPDVLYATGNPWSAALGMAVCLATAWKKLPMAGVAALGAGAAVLAEVLLTLL